MRNLEKTVHSCFINNSTFVISRLVTWFVQARCSMKTYYQPLKSLQNAPYYQYRTTLNKARELAARKDVEGLQDLAATEVC